MKTGLSTILAGGFLRASHAGGRTGRRGGFSQMLARLSRHRGARPRALVRGGREVTFEGVPFVNLQGEKLEIFADPRTGRVQVRRNGSRPGGRRGGMSQRLDPLLRRELQLSGNSGVDRPIPNFRAVVEQHLRATRDLRHGILTGTLETPGTKSSRLLRKLRAEVARKEPLDVAANARAILDQVNRSNGKNRGAGKGKGAAVTVGNGKDSNTAKLKEKLPHPLEKQVKPFVPPRVKPDGAAVRGKGKQASGGAAGTGQPSPKTITPMGKPGTPGKTRITRFAQEKGLAVEPREVNDGNGSEAAGRTGKGKLVRHISVRSMTGKLSPPGEEVLRNRVLASLKKQIASRESETVDRAEPSAETAKRANARKAKPRAAAVQPGKPGAAKPRAAAARPGKPGEGKAARPAERKTEGEPIKSDGAKAADPEARSEAPVRKAKAKVQPDDPRQSGKAVAKKAVDKGFSTSSAVPAAPVVSAKEKIAEMKSRGWRVHTPGRRAGGRSLRRGRSAAASQRAGASHPAVRKENAPRRVDKGEDPQTNKAPLSSEPVKATAKAPASAGPGNTAPAAAPKTATTPTHTARQTGSTTASGSGHTNTAGSKGTEAGQAIQNLDEVLRRVEGRARILTSDGRTTLQVRLKPSSLGMLMVQIREKAGKYEVTLRAEHAQAAQAIESRLPQLREQLASQGIDVQRFHVETGTRENQPRGDEQGEPNTHRSGGDGTGTAPGDEETPGDGRRRFLFIGTNTVDYIG